MRHPLEEIHVTDSVCAARFKADAENPPPPGEGATRGNLAHEIIENYTVLQAEHTSIDPMTVVRDVLRTHRLDPDVTERVIRDVVTIMAGAFASGLDFKLREGGWETAPEWRWALDEDFEPIAPCAKCDGSGVTHTPLAGRTPLQLVPTKCGCERGWSKAPAYSGTVDRLEFHRKQARATVYDWKTILAYESGAQIADKPQPNWYVFATLRTLPWLKEVEFKDVLLRHGYPARHVFVRGEPWEERTRLQMQARRDKRLSAIESGVWPETPSEECSYCCRLYVCGIKNRLREMGAEPAGDPTELAGLRFFAKALYESLDRHLRTWVEMNGKPIPLAEGKALGMKPVDGWRLAQSYESTMSALEALGMTADERVEWFRYCGRGDIGSRVLKALSEKMGRKQATLLVESGQFLEPIVEETFSTWTPPVVATAREVSASELDDYLDRVLDGG